MKLSVPVDVYILFVMSDGERTTPVRMKWELENDFGDAIASEWRDKIWGREYLSHRLSDLHAWEFIERLPPEGTGLYVITRFGRVALRDYLEDGRTEFSFGYLASEAESVEDEGRPETDIEWLTSS